jgi:hypothetical protein
MAAKRAPLQTAMMTESPGCINEALLTSLTNALELSHGCRAGLIEPIALGQ